MSVAEKTRSVTLRVCSSLRSIPNLQSAWNDLLAASVYPSVFRRWEWLDAWWKWFGGGRKLHIMLVYAGPTLVGALPCYQATRPRFRPLRAPVLKLLGAGGPTCPEYLGPIIHRDYFDPVLQQILAQLRSTTSDWQSIEFADVPPDDTATCAWWMPWPLSSP